MISLSQRGQIILLTGMFFIGSAFGVPLASRQRGAVLFMNYCAGCHAVRYLSWPTMMKDLNLHPQDSFVFSPRVQLKVLDLSTSWPQIGLAPQDAEGWFAKMPPDLSTIARQRGSHWLTAYLHGFYPDHARPFGTTNTMMQNVMMPNILAPLQDELTEQEFAVMVNDIVSFLDYAAEPSLLVRYDMGVKVLGFLSMLLLLIWLRFRACER